MANFDFEYLQTEALTFDKQDSLSSFRTQFHIPKADYGLDCIYYCGNSLGLQPKSIAHAINIELDDWAKHGVEAHFMGRNPWKDYHEFATNNLAKVVGAKPLEVVAMNSLTVNLNLLLVSFYRPTKQKHKIIIEANPFPSDIYSVKSHIKYHGFDPDTSLIILPQNSNSDPTHNLDTILSTIEQHADQLALVMISGVNYYTGQAFDLQSIADKAHQVGALAGFDLAHAVGNLDLKLHQSGADFATWCSYKYLNSGPGATSGIFIHEKHAHNFEIPRFAGWWGQNKDNRFLMGPEFEPLVGAEGWQNSNPAILPLACLKASLEIFDDAGIENLRQKSIKLTDFTEKCIVTMCGNQVEIITPKESQHRGCQLSLRIKNNKGKQVFDNLSENGVIADWRHPDVIRIAPVPLYNQFIESYKFALKLKNALVDL